jgi:hypothetical protein
MNRDARTPRRKGSDSNETEDTTDRAPTAAEQGANVAPEKPGSKKRSTKKKGAPKAKRGAKSKKPAKVTAKKSTSERSNKKAEVIALMKRAKGVTLAEIVEVTGWQKHTIRGFVSLLASKGGEKIESSKSADGERTYRIARKSKLFVSLRYAALALAAGRRSCV